MSTEARLPKRVLAVIEHCRSTGDRLVRSYRARDGAEPEETWHFEPTGRSAPPRSSAQAATSGLLKPLGDGLFGPDTSQSWGA